MEPFDTGRVVHAVGRAHPMNGATVVRTALPATTGASATSGAFARCNTALGEAPARDNGRRRLRWLDACLQSLEDAHERNEVQVAPRLAERLREHVATIQPGMQITEAIDAVLAAQEPYLLRVPAR